MTADLKPSSGKRWALAIFGIIMIVVGAPLVIGGIDLILLGGSWYYAPAGAGVIFSGILFMRRYRAAFWVYAVVFAATIAWALWEVGLDFWPLVPRLSAPMVLGIFVLLFSTLLTSSSACKAACWAGACVLMLGLIVGSFYLFLPHDVSYDATAQSPRPPPRGEPSAEWRHYGRTPAGTRYIPFDQITPENVGELEIAWTYRTGKIADGPAEDQNTPLQIGDTLYTCTPRNVVIALDAETGAERWRFDPKAQSPVWNRCRGVGYYDAAAHDPAIGQNETCRQRIVTTTIDRRLIEIDAKTGELCRSFGKDGVVSLDVGIGEIKPGYYFQTSAPTVMRDMILVGGWVYDNRETGEPSGVVRAFSARNGELVWAWDLGNPNITKLPPEGEFYTRGTPNVWSTPAFDEELGLVYLPTGNATPDYWGGERTELQDRYSSSVVALNIETGKEQGRFQTVHHDLWDYDIPAQPALYDIPDGKGGVIPALIQVTKTGQIFVLDRSTGEPLTAVEERPVPQGDAKGERYSSTQPFSVGMPAIGLDTLTEADMWGATPYDQLLCRIEFRSMRYEGPFTPPATDRPSLQSPGNYGGMNWGSVSINEETATLIVNDIRIPLRVQLVDRDTMGETGAHGSAKMEGTPYGVINQAFMSPLGVPCRTPPYGTMTAIDLQSRQIVWQVPMGSIQDTGLFGIVSHMHIPLGMPTLGGPITTKSGLVFYAGTQDFYLRAIDQRTGEELWRGRLPVGAQSTPISYVSEQSGRQFVVVSAGGARQSPVRGDYIVAYTLPKGR